MAQKKRKDPHAVALGRKGGKARVSRLSKQELREAAKAAARARWSRVKRQAVKEGGP